jgi:hypothetical protein
MDNVNELLSLHIFVTSQNKKHMMFCKWHPASLFTIYQANTTVSPNLMS